MTETVARDDVPATDVVDELTDDHHQVLELLERIPATRVAQERRDMADTAIAEVVRHSVAEEMYVYPAMTEALDHGGDTVEHDKEEHNKLERIMKDLEGVDGDDPQFDTLVGDMARALRHHAQEEETEQFPRMRERMSKETLLELRRKVQAAKKIAPTRPHPDAPNSELFHKMAGPGVGLVDRLRDRLSGREAG
ncbi:hemerythrin domain-containing protein [Pseudonocardia kujensis]|uniref:hemerythrin domain-containing protein n=1 Tax=Pseudonocardia kujensis TaxID=1128675 RepID=UPI001E5B1517|nr:hemerythrin domain-containing protein [Pseudonocardia kujensis]MCE0763837.1 hemerythrin domain-containing protein [Pseudonocardia kujensis]